MGTQIEFLRPMTVSILSERRAYAPFGLQGGEDAQPGQNLIIRSNHRLINIGAKSSVSMQAGERLRILTPGRHWQLWWLHALMVGGAGQPCIFPWGCREVPGHHVLPRETCMHSCWVTSF